MERACSAPSSRRHRLGSTRAACLSELQAPLETDTGRCHPRDTSYPPRCTRPHVMHTLRSKLRLSMNWSNDPLANLATRVDVYSGMSAMGQRLLLQQAKLLSYEVRISTRESVEDCPLDSSARTSLGVRRADRDTHSLYARSSASPANCCARASNAVVKTTMALMDAMMARERCCSGAAKFGHFVSLSSIWHLYRNGRTVAKRADRLFPPKLKRNARIPGFPSRNDIAGRRLPGFVKVIRMLRLPRLDR
eukprot:scaffold529_cov308-Pinguiococcus_pyrenoidosus.AAC.39